jgi:succinyl-diaminopimelate desuccinylase
MSIEKAVSKLTQYRNELAEICSQLIKRPSAHPEGKTVECVSYIKTYFERLGIRTEIFKKNDDKPNLVARIGQGTGRKIMWVGHLDVVPPGNPKNWTLPPYCGTIAEDGTIWGRGSSDMKGACAAAMVAARVLNELNELETIPNAVDFWFTADEEIGGGDGALWLAQTGILEGEVCIIGDGAPGTPFAPTIDLGCKGAVWTKILAQGKTAHGSRPFLGDNALDKLLRVIPHVKKIAQVQLDIPKELEPVLASTINYMMKEQLDDQQRIALKRLFHYPSVALNILNGGVKINVVPDSAEAHFDIRLTPGSNPIRIRERISQLVKEAGEQALTVEFQNLSATAGYYESPNTPFAMQLAKTVKKITGNPPIFKILTGGTDAIPIKRYVDIPCLGFGSSIEGQAHVPNEHNSLDLLMMSAKVYATFPIIFKPAS